MIQFATPGMETVLQTIWNDCFGDNDAYTRFIFDHLLRTDRILVHCNDKQIPHAMLCLQPFTLASSRGDVPGAYIFGVATSPAHQKQGLSTKLMEACHTHLAKNRFALSALVPATAELFQFYTKRGFETAFSIARDTFSADTLPHGRRNCVLIPARLDDLYALRERIYQTRSHFVRWDKEYLHYIGSECRTFGGEALKIGCCGELGYAVCYRDGTRVIIKELALADDLIPDALSALHQRFRAETYTLYLPADTLHLTNKVLPFAMVQWYDKKKQERLATARGEAAWIAHCLD